MAKIKSKHGMSVAEGTCWFFLNLCTIGLTYPAYRARKHKLDRVTTTYIPYRIARRLVRGLTAAELPRVPLLCTLTQWRD